MEVTVAISRMLAPQEPLVMQMDAQGARVRVPVGASRAVRYR